MQFLPSKDVSHQTVDTPNLTVNFRSEHENISLSKDNLDKLQTQFTECLISVLPELSEAYAKIQESNKITAEAQKNTAEAKFKLVQLEAKLIEADAKLIEADEALKQIAVEAQNIMTRQFHSIFSGGKMELPPEQTSEIFQTYLADRSVTSEKSEGKYFSKINSMTSVIKYLNEHDDVRTCDFRRFKAEINDIPTLVAYLKNSSIRTVAFLDSISEAAKAALAEAVDARATSSTPLKIRYYPSKN